VRALEVGKCSRRDESSDVDGLWVLLVIEVEEAIADNGWERSRFGHVV
jgi:hypothetical protein